MRKSKETITLQTLEKEKNSLQEQIERASSEIIQKKKSLTELKEKLAATEDKIQAKKLETLSGSINSRYGISMEDFMQAVADGNVLVDVKREDKTI